MDSHYLKCIINKFTVFHGDHAFNFNCNFKHKKNVKYEIFRYLLGSSP